MNDTTVQLVFIVKEYLREYDTPAPDLSYRANLRERMRNALASFENEASLK